MATKKTKTGKGKDGGGKKPVWVDEEAHSVLKEWAGLTRTSMVDAASALVLESLAEAEASDDTLIGAEEVAAPAPAAPAPVAAAPAAPAPAAVAAPAPAPAPAPTPVTTTVTTVTSPAPAPAPRKKRTQKPPAPGTIKQHVGGVWLV